MCRDKGSLMGRDKDIPASRRAWMSGESTSPMAEGVGHREMLWEPEEC